MKRKRKFRKDRIESTIHMKRIDFENGTITGNILGAALPMLIAQILNLLYNIVDRIYIARIPEIGTAALGAVGLCFPIIVIITAFSNLFGTGGAPLFSIFRGKKDPDTARRIMNTSFTMLCVCAVILMAVGFLFARPILILFGASADAIVYAYPYMMLYLIGTLPSMIAVGMNPFINAQGYSSIGMLSVAIGAGTNLVLDPLFIFALGLGVRGAAIATVISQCLSAAFVVFFLTKKSELKLRFLHKNEIPECTGHAKNILSLGAAGFIMQLTNSLVTICCNNILSVTGGDIYISVMTIISSVRQLVETPIHAMVEGTSPILSYNYGARKPDRVKKTIKCAMFYAEAIMLVGFLLFQFLPDKLLGLFSASEAMLAIGKPALRIICFHFLLAGMSIILSSTFQALGNGMFSLIISVCRQLVVLLPAAWLLSKTGNVNMVWWSFVIAELVSVTLSFVFFARLDKKIIEPMYDNAAAAQ